MGKFAWERAGFVSSRRWSRSFAFSFALIAILWVLSRFVQSIDDISGIHTMNLAAIDLNLLVALDALLSEGHVGRAARRIGRSQPATSHALNRLRDLLSDSVLVRVGSSMELTPRAAGAAETPARSLAAGSNSSYRGFV